MTIQRQLLLPDFSYIKDTDQRMALESIKKVLEELNRAVYGDLGAGSGGTPSTVEIADAADAGTSATAAKSDHIHAVGDPTAPGALTNPQTATEGTSVIPMRSDAKAGIPSPATPTTQTDPSTASSGAGTGFATDTHLHGVATPATPTTQAFSDSATSGAGTGFATDTHKHGMPAAPAVAATTVFTVNAATTAITDAGFTTLNLDTAAITRTSVQVYKPDGMDTLHVTLRAKSAGSTAANVKVVFGSVTTPTLFPTFGTSIGTQTVANGADISAATTGWNAVSVQVQDDGGSDTLTVYELYIALAT